MTSNLEPTAAERLLIESVARGEVADYRTRDRKRDEPASGNLWGEERTLRAEIVREVCLGRNADRPVHPKGVAIIGAKIVGALDFQSAELSVPFCLWHCHIENDIILREAITRTVILDGCHLKGIQAAGLTTTGNVFLRSGFVAKGEVRLLGANIGGSFDCQGAFLQCPGGVALSADGLVTQGRVSLSDGFVANGEVRFLGARISGAFRCDGGRFDNPKGVAFGCDGMKVGGALSLRGAIAIGEVRLLDADIDGRLDCEGAIFENPKSTAFFAESLTTKGPVSLNNATFNGHVNLFGANIGSHLKCDGATFANPKLVAVYAERLTTKGSASLKRAKATGQVNLYAASIGSNLDCRGAELRNEGAIALGADGLTARGNVKFSDGFKAFGQVRLPGAKIDGDLDCVGATLENPNHWTLFADSIAVRDCVFLKDRFSSIGEVRLVGAEIGQNLECDGAVVENREGVSLNAHGLTTTKGGVFLRAGFTANGTVALIAARIGSHMDCRGGAFESHVGCALDASHSTIKGNVHLERYTAPTGQLKEFVARGEVRFSGADIGGDLVCRGAVFENPKENAFSCSRARVNGTLVWEALVNLPKGIVDLQHASVGQLKDDRASWPKTGHFRLDGFAYNALADGSPMSWRDRLEWMNRQPREGFWPQPYEQLVQVYRRAGHERDAREIAIAKQDRFLACGDLTWPSRFWLRILRFTIGYGYKPWVAGVYLLFILILGTVLFGYAGTKHVMVPAKERIYMAPDYQPGELPSEYPQFQPFLYSLDVLLPIVDLHQESYWLPTASSEPYGWVRWYMWLHIALGWVLTTIGVVGLTGLVKKD